ncbi:MAG: phosphotransferase enzyme family protein, partial [Thermomicrobiales bacterium]
FDRTLSPDGQSAVADLLAAPWSPDPGSVRFFRTSANVILTLRRDGERAFLRASASSERDRPTIEGELRLIDTLAAQGIPVVSAIPDNDGDRIATVDTPLGRFHTVLFIALPGTIRDSDALSSDDFARWGAAVGRIHAGLAGVAPETIARPPSWQTAFAAIAAHTAVPDATKEGAMRLRERLERLPRTPDWYGPLHGDLELDNLTWDSGTIWALDFDAASCGWYLLDIAKALADPFATGLTPGDEPIAAFLAGYRQYRPLPDEALAMLPDVRLLSRTIDYASLLHAMDVTKADADVDWLRRLIVRLSGWMRETESLLVS